MDDKLQNKIDSYFEKLTEFINKLPLSDKGKNYIWSDSFCKFYDEPVISENGTNTYGIQTEWQLQRFIEEFKKNLKKSRLKAIEKWTDELNHIEPSEAVAKIDKHLYQLKQKELLSEIGGESLSDWQSWLKKYLTNEIDHQQKKPATKPKKQQNKTTYQWQNNPDKEIPELHRLMIEKYKLIAPETTYEQFKAIFTGQPIDTINPIKWHQDNASELIYFNEAIKSKVNSVWHIYQRMAACFVKPNGKPFNSSFKELKQTISINLSPDKQRAIDELVNTF